MNDVDAKLQSLGRRTAGLLPPTDRIHAALEREAASPTRGPDLSFGGGRVRLVIVALIALFALLGAGAVFVLLIAGA